MFKRILRVLAPVLLLAALPALSSAEVYISVGFAPPPLPVYVQPPCPSPGYIWVPGYWGWNDGAYYWVPGTWVLPPQVGLLWTPGYWGWNYGVYRWHPGYWGPQVGFYGGINYGFGYDGDGFEGGYWQGGMFFYNRAVWTVGPAFVTNVYYRRPVYYGGGDYRGGEDHVSFNGGPDGVRARPTRLDLMAERDRRAALTAEQQRQQQIAFSHRTLRADFNHGRPPIAATDRPAVFRGRGVIPARAAGGTLHLPVRSAPLRTDRPAWASGQGRVSARMSPRSAPGRAGGPVYRPQSRWQSAPRAWRPAGQSYPQVAPQRRFQGSPGSPWRSAAQPPYRAAPPQRFQGASPWRPARSWQRPAPQPSFRGAPAWRAAPRFAPRYAPQGGFRAAPARPQFRGGVRPAPAPARRPPPRGPGRG